MPVQKLTLSVDQCYRSNIMNLQRRQPRSKRLASSNGDGTRGGDFRRSWAQSP